MTRQQLARLVAEIPPQSRPLFELLASTGLRISEAIGLRVMDAGLDTDAPCVHVRRAIVNGQLTAPKSRHGRRTIPISLELADRLRSSRPAAPRPSCSSVAPRARRYGQAICATACSYRPRSAPAFLGRAFTRCATPARRCSSTLAPARCASSAGWAITPPRSPWIPTATCSATISARIWTWASRCGEQWAPASLGALARSAVSEPAHSTGTSRKPLVAQAAGGFESFPPLRWKSCHSHAARTIWRMSWSGCSRTP